MTKTNKYFIIALATALILVLLSIPTLMLRPLYLWDTDAVLRLHTLLIDGKEIEYDQHDNLGYDSIFVPFLKGEKLENADPSGKYNVYRWRIEPKSSTEYLILEPTEEWVDMTTKKLGKTYEEDIANFKKLTIVKKYDEGGKK